MEVRNICERQEVFAGDINGLAHPSLKLCWKIFYDAFW